MQYLVACIQMNSTDVVKQNLLVAKELILNAVEQGAKLIVLPENFALMSANDQDKLNYQEHFGQGPIQDFLSDAAREYNVWIVGGTIPLATEKNNKKVFASCLVFNNEGQCVGRYDKIHLFDVQIPTTNESYFESKTILPGNEICVLDTPFGKLGLAVCYDLRFPEMFRLMSNMGVEIIAIPSAFTFKTGSAHWDVLLRARAIENLVYVLAAGQTGLHSNLRKTYGNSMVINPWGEVLVCLPESSGVVLGEINLRFLHEIRQDFPVLMHRKKI